MIKKLLLFPFMILRFWPQYYYITGTGKAKESGERVFFRVCLQTYGGTIPIYDTEIKVMETLNLDGAVVLNYQKISLLNSKLIGESYKLGTVEKTKKQEEKEDLLKAILMSTIHDINTRS